MPTIKNRLFTPSDPMSIGEQAEYKRATSDSSPVRQLERASKQSVGKLRSSDRQQMLRGGAKGSVSSKKSRGVYGD